MIDHSSFEFAPWNNIDAVSDDWQNYPGHRHHHSGLVDRRSHRPAVRRPHRVGLQPDGLVPQHLRELPQPESARQDQHVFVNNVLYNDSAGYTTHTSTNFTHDILNNYFIFGPASTGTDNTWYQVDKNQSIYYAGNLKDTNLNGTLDGAATTPYWYQGTGHGAHRPLVERDHRHARARHRLRGARRHLARRNAAARSDRRPDHQPGDDAGQGNDRQPAPTPSAPTAGSTPARPQTGLPNNGYGAIAGGTRPTDTDNDGMPDSWESATGSNPSADDAMTKAADGYALIEHYMNWLAGPHASAAAGASVDVDLSAYTTGFSAVSPTFVVSGAQNGTVALQADNHTAQFQPTAGFHGLASFTFSVTGSDGSAYTSQVVVLVTP